MDQGRRRVVGSRRDEILRAFITLIDRQGINRTTMLDVSHEMGCSVGTLYNEFANKEALIDAYAAYVLTLARASAEESVNPNLTPFEQLRSLLLGHVIRINQLVHQNRAALDIISDVNSFRYIGKKNMNMRQEVRTVLWQKIQQILQEGARNKIFGRIALEPDTARLIVDAFTEYWSPPLIVNRNSADVLRDAEKMLDLMLQALRFGPEDKE